MNVPGGIQTNFTPMLLVKSLGGSFGCAWAEKPLARAKPERGRRGESWIETSRNRWIQSDQHDADDPSGSLPDDKAIATGFEAIGVECTQRRTTLTYQIAVSLVVEPIAGEVDDFEISPNLAWEKCDNWPKQQNQ
jgi:hypothetical protein